MRQADAGMTTLGNSEESSWRERVEGGKVASAQSWPLQVRGAWGEGGGGEGGDDEEEEEARGVVVVEWEAGWGWGKGE